MKHSERMANAIYLCRGGVNCNQPSKPYMSTGQARQNLFNEMGIKYNHFSNKIPKTAEGTFNIEGFIFRLYRGFIRSRGEPAWLPRKSTPETHPPTPAEIKYNRWADRAHRLYIACPDCPDGRLIPVGRLAQHAVVHIKRNKK